MWDLPSFKSFARILTRICRWFLSSTSLRLRTLPKEKPTILVHLERISAAFSRLKVWMRAWSRASKPTTSQRHSATLSSIACMSFNARGNSFLATDSGHPLSAGSHSADDAWKKTGKFFPSGGYRTRWKRTDSAAVRLLRAGSCSQYLGSGFNGPRPD